MDLFYIPPLQRIDECEALEENYVNCLVQKSLKDRVLTDRCVMESLLWFHLECPKAAAKFDDPIEFKRKFRNFFAYQRASAELLFRKTDEQKAILSEFGHARYPEEIRKKADAVAFRDEFREHDPIYNPGDETLDEFLEPSSYETELAEKKDKRTIRYDHPVAGLDLSELTPDHSARFGSAEPL